MCCSSFSTHRPEPGLGAGRAQRGGGLGRRLGRGAALAGVAAALLLPALSSTPAGVAHAAAEGMEPFTAVRLAQLRAEGRPVFVNMTAAWCVSCLASRRMALGTQAVRAAFDAHEVARLKGRWTPQDAAVPGFPA